MFNKQLAFRAGNASVPNPYTPPNGTWTVSGNISATRFIGADGTAAAPTFTFLNELDCGIYLSDADPFVGVSINGTLIGRWQTNGYLNSTGTIFSDQFAAVSGSSNQITFTSQRGVTITQTAQTSGSPNAFVLTGGAHTGLTASTIDIGMNLNFGATKTWATGDISSQAEIVITAPTYAFAGASTFTGAVYTVSIGGAPSAGTNVTSMVRPVALAVEGTGTWPTAATFNPSALRVGGGTLTLTGTTNITSVPGPANVAINSMTLTDASSVTVTNASSLYISAAPTAAGSVTITNAYAIWVDSGLCRFDGDGTHIFEIPTQASAALVASRYIPIKDGASTYYIMVSTVIV